MAARAADNGERWRMPPQGRAMLRRRAAIVETCASQLVWLVMDRVPAREAQIRLRVKTARYERASRMLRTARALAAGSGVPLTVDEALREAADLYVVRAIRLGELRCNGFGRRESQERLGCSDEEWETADEWLRDVQAELEDSDDSPVSADPPESAEVPESARR